MAQQTSVSSLLDMTSSSNVVFLGEAGSGKSEIALNFAQALAELGGKPVHFFDLDMTKPLFRSRDRREALEALGVEVHYEAQFMDAPTLTGGVRQRLNLIMHEPMSSTMTPEELTAGAFCRASGLGASVRVALVRSSRMRPTAFAAVRPP